MNGFVSYTAQILEVVERCVATPALHVKWLNTLSFLENCGARMIAACEHPTLVRREMLKHAAEEFRHAHYLKRQIEKVSEKVPPTYSRKSLLGGRATMHYLPSLDIQACRYIRGIHPSSIREHAYLLVTYAIERRASELYPLYRDVLKRAGSPVKVQSILLEEAEHLREMEEGITLLRDGWEAASRICAIESRLFHKWISHVDTHCGVRTDN